MNNPDTSTSSSPVIVVGAGPIGLAAAANLRHRGVDFLVLESGPTAGSAVLEWAHIRLFSPWSELIDPVAGRLLDARGWTPPSPERYPSGADWIRDYLQPLADLLGDSVRYGTTVTGIAKTGRDRLVDSGRETQTFTVHVETTDGAQQIVARAVIDASGTWTGPNPLGGDGLPAIGELAAADRITYRAPDFRTHHERARYAGRHVVVAGTGASAKGVLIALKALIDEEPSTRVSWLVRRATVGEAFAGSDDDDLVERGALGRNAKLAVASRGITTVNGFRTSAVMPGDDGLLTVESIDGQQVTDADEVIVLTGFRPDLSFLSEVRLDLDPVLQAPRQLAPLIDPNVHSCGTVYPHGAKELAQPEVRFFPVGMKSYGRATSFLALTGFEQARSVVAEIIGDHEAAARVELTLPASGVCGGAGAFDEEGAGGGCCGSSGPELIDLTVRG